ncbi:MAG: fatty-acyl-CoA synthase, partial [Gammaproteobacteria bacterium]
DAPRWPLYRGRWARIRRDSARGVLWDAGPTPPSERLSPPANEESWDADGWFYSGDLATVDDAGDFRIVGRNKDVIIRGGANISPREVEEALSTHPAVREVSVIGLPDDYYGEIVCACVIPTASCDLTLDEARAHLEPKLASFKLPVHLALLESFPLNSMGKVQKAALRETVIAQR